MGIKVGWIDVCLFQRTVNVSSMEGLGEFILFLGVVVGRINQSNVNNNGRTTKGITGRHPPVGKKLGLSPGRMEVRSVFLSSLLPSHHPARPNCHCPACPPSGIHMPGNNKCLGRVESPPGVGLHLGLPPAPNAWEWSQGTTMLTVCQVVVGWEVWGEGSLGSLNNKAGRVGQAGAHLPVSRLL